MTLEHIESIEISLNEDIKNQLSEKVKDLFYKNNTCNYCSHPDRAHKVNLERGRLHIQFTEDDTKLMNLPTIHSMTCRICETLLNTEQVVCWKTNKDAE